MAAFKTRSALLMLLPATACYALVVLYPMVRGLVLSLTSSSGVDEPRFVGLDNYRTLLQDPDVPVALRNTMLFTAIVVIVQNVLALGLARLLYRQRRVRDIARIGLLVPSMLSVVVVGYVWSYLYSPLGGPLDTLLAGLGWESLRHVWLGEESTALVAIAVANIWMYAGYSTAIYLANFLSIPPDVLEAAQVDGAGVWQRFRRVEFPQLAPSITVNLTISTIGTMKVFEFPFVMTNGGPADATLTLSMLIYQRAFASYQFGYATAIAVVLLVLTVLVAVFQATVLGRREARL